MIAFAFFTRLRVWEVAKWLIDPRRGYPAAAGRLAHGWRHERPSSHEDRRVAAEAEGAVGTGQASGEEDAVSYLRALPPFGRAQGKPSPSAAHYAVSAGTKHALAGDDPAL